MGGGQGRQPAEPTPLPSPGLTIAAAEAAVEAIRADVCDSLCCCAVVQDVLRRAAVTALLQPLPVQLVLLLQQRVQHALHLRWREGRGYSETLSSPGAARAELSRVLQVRVRGNRTTPVLLCPAANISHISPLDISHLDEAPGGTGGLPGRPAGGQTQPLARAQHSCAGLHREKLSQVSTLGTGLPSQHQVMPPLWPPTSSTRKTKVTRPPDSGRGANSGTQRVSKLVYLVSAEGCRRIIYP